MSAAALLIAAIVGASPVCPTCVTGSSDVAALIVVRQGPASFAIRSIAAGVPALAPTGAGDVAGQEERPADAWLAEDKLKHFTVSFGATTFGYGAATLAGLDHGAGVGTAVGVAAALGVAKEFRDRRLGGPFSVRDLVWDAAGIALGLLLVDSTR